MDVNSSIADIAKALEEEEPDDVCSFCELDDIKKIYFESNKMIVMDCSECKSVVIIFKRHVVKARTKVDGKMIWRLSKVCDKVYGKNNWTLDKDTKENPKHVHYHGRLINKGEK